MNSSSSNVVLYHSPTMFKLILYSLSCLYVLICVLGVTGNGLVCYILLFRLKRTATSAFLLNLAVSDGAVALICVPMTLLADCLLLPWVFGATLCRLLPFLQASSVLLSAFTHVLIGMDRYLAVFRPLRRRRHLTPPRALLLLACLWLICFAASLPTALFSKLIRSSPSANFYCQEQWSSATLAKYYTGLILLLQYVLPLLVIIISYSAIAVRVWRQRTPGESIRTRDEVILHSKKKMIKMFVIVAVFYSLSQLPRHVVYLVSLIQKNFWINTSHFYIMNSCHLLSMSACFYNPLLYIWLNAAFRRTFCQLMAHHCFCHRQCGCCPQDAVMTGAASSVVMPESRRLTVTCAAPTRPHRHDSDLSPQIRRAIPTKEAISDNVSLHIMGKVSLRICHQSNNDLV